MVRLRGTASATRRRVWSSSVAPPNIGQNCLGRSSPAISRVNGRSLVPSPPARITAQRSALSGLNRSVMHMVFPSFPPQGRGMTRGLHLNGQCFFFPLTQLLADVVGLESQGLAHVVKGKHGISIPVPYPTLRLAKQALPLAVAGAEIFLERGDGVFQDRPHEFCFGLREALAADGIEILRGDKSVRLKQRSDFFSDAVVRVDSVAFHRHLRKGTASVLQPRKAWLLADYPFNCNQL